MKASIRFSAILLASFRCWAAITVAPGTDPNTFVLNGKIVTPDDIVDGKLVIKGTLIACVGVDCTVPAGATSVTVTDAWIFPGFIDAHNHVAYNVLPKFTPPHLFHNRGEWQRAKEYKKFKAPYDVLVKQKHLACEVIKYGEMKALISGITTIQGTSPASTCIRTLIRNAENENELDVSPKLIRTFILDIANFKVAEEKMDFTVTKSFVVHLAEGIDKKSRDEFLTLKAKGLLAPATAIIHGTAFEEAQFEEMAHVGAKLIWSPQSNLALYGKTTQIPLALKHGIHVSLAVDWNPTGSDNIFQELRVASQVNTEQFGGAIPQSSWVKMITLHPAEALALNDKIGSLAPGLKADITVLAAQDPEPGASLLKTHLQDVQMVWVGGKLLYGNSEVVQQIKPDVCEPLQVHGSSKRICVKDAKNVVPKSDETKEAIQTVLQANFANLAPLVP
jgi:5-methylthioadenosine/S-adenosylhomocysteine deaminase